jgi:hypothetical protein
MNNGGLPISGDVDAQVTYEKKSIPHVTRLETDTFELCKPKIIRKRVKLIGEKVVIVHYRAYDDYTINEIS